VFYIDYGNSEWILPDFIRVLPARFTKVPMFAVCCRLSGVEPRETVAARVPGPQKWPAVSAEEFKDIIHFDDFDEILSAMLDECIVTGAEIR